MTVKSKKNNWLFVTLLCLGLMWSNSGFTTAAVVEAFSQEEYQRKADIILNFCRLSEWPTETFSTPDQKFVIGVLGEDPIAPFIDQLAGKTVSERTVKVVRYTAADDYTKAHALFIGRSEQRNLKDIFTRLSGRGVMTIGDTDRFAEAGGMVGFTYQTLPESPTPNARKVYFKINWNEFRAADIRIGFTLIKLGEIVQTEIVPDDIDSELINIAILPAWEFHNPQGDFGFGKGFYQALGANKNFKITHAADPKLAKNIGADTLKFSPADGKLIWKAAGKLQHSAPDLGAIHKLVDGLNVRAVFMYSSPPVEHQVRAFLVDLKTDKVYQVDGNFGYEISRNYANQSKALGDEFLRNYFEDLASPQIRLAILPAWESHNPNARGIGRGFYQALGANKNFKITHAADPKLAKRLGADTLKFSPADGKLIWKAAGKLQHSAPDLGAIHKLVDGLNVRAVFMYSSPPVDLMNVTRRAFLVDLKTDKVYQVEEYFAYKTSQNYANQSKALGDELLRSYFEDLAATPFRLAILPAHNTKTWSKIRNKDVFLPLAGNKQVVVTHATDPKLATALGAANLETNSSQKNRLWQNAARYQSGYPDVAAVRDILRGVNVQAALMYSYPHTAPAGELDVFLVDIKTGEVVSAHLTTDTSAQNLPGQVKYVAYNLVKDYLDSLGESRTKSGTAEASRINVNTKNTQ